MSWVRTPSQDVLLPLTSAHFIPILEPNLQAVMRRSIGE